MAVVVKLKWNVGLQQTGAAATFCRSVRDDSTAASMGRHHICTARYVLQRRKRKKKKVSILEDVAGEQIIC